MTASDLIVNTRSASTLHSRLQNGTRKARSVAVPEAQAAPRRTRRRVSESAIWRMFDDLRLSATAKEPAASHDRALRQVLSAMVEGTTRESERVELEPVEGPVLIVRSGPWPVLKAVIEAIAEWPVVPPITVLCHARDAEMLEALARENRIPLQPLFYPRFEPFNPATLKRMLVSARGRWAATLLLDAARSGTSRSLDHITRTVASQPGEKYVWNASGQIYRPLSLLETLGRERYEIVRRLLRWRARGLETN
jgi:hypothetical protein